MIATRMPRDLVERLKTNPFRKANRYVSWNGVQLLAETTCKVCGEALTALGPDPRFAPRRRVLHSTDEKTVILETLVSRFHTPAFATIEFEVEEPVPAFEPEGDETRDEIAPRLGVHRTALCKGCKARLLTDDVPDLDEVQQLYEADLERMAVEDDINRKPEEHTLAVLTQLASRKVTRVLG